MTTTAKNITDKQIRAFALEAADAGDDAAAHCAWVALGEREPGVGGQQWPHSQEEGRAEVARMIANAEAMAD